uniref:Uncharacterized protein n=1 Tax=Lepeophtheirus salmonis TaxID=72036 RepID=A0A0K2SZ70_LEPSM
MCNKVVFPALSRPKNKSFPDFFQSPKYPRTPVNQSTKNIFLN